MGENILSELLLTAIESMTPIFEAAEGLKAQLEKRGWSPTAAEEVALTWLVGAIEHSWRSS